MGLRSFPNQTKHGMEYHQCNESVKQKTNFGLTCLGKKIGFSYGLLRISRIANFWEFQKNCFSLSQGVVQIKQKLGMQYHQCNESEKQKNFWYTVSGKKLVLHKELFEFRKKRNF